MRTHAATRFDPADGDRPVGGKAPVGRPPERIRVIIRQKQRGEEPLDHDVLWPKGWPLPEVGSVVLAGPLAGFVEHLEFDVDAQRILCVLR